MCPARFGNHWCRPLCVQVSCLLKYRLLSRPSPSFWVLGLWLGLRICNAIKFPGDATAAFAGPGNHTLSTIDTDLSQDSPVPDWSCSTKKQQTDSVARSWISLVQYFAFLCRGLLGGFLPSEWALIDGRLSLRKVSSGKKMMFAG